MPFIPRLNTPLGSWAKKDSCCFYFFSVSVCLKLAGFLQNMENLWIWRVFSWHPTLRHRTERRSQAQNGVSARATKAPVKASRCRGKFPRNFSQVSGCGIFSGCFMFKTAHSLARDIWYRDSAPDQFFGNLDPGCRDHWLLHLDHPLVRKEDFPTIGDCKSGI